MSNPPLQNVSAVAFPVLATTAEGEGQQLPVGVILLATVDEPPAGGAPGSVQLVLDSGPVALIRPGVAFPAGERLAFQVEGEGGQQTLQVLARSGEPGAPLETLSLGQARLAQNQSLTSEVRALLSNARGVILGEVLNFQARGAALVRVGSLSLNFQLDAGARPGDHLFIRPLAAGGGLALNVFARGGPLSAPLPSGAAVHAQVLRADAARVQAPAPEGLPAPGTILTGRLISVSGPGAPAGLPGKPVAGVSPLLPDALPAERSGEGRITPLPTEGRISSQVGAQALSRGQAAGEAPRFSGQTALFRFPGLDAEVPWPLEAAASFSPGSPVRVLVNQVVPIMDLMLLPPGNGNAIGGAGYVPSGEVGVAGFGANLIALAEGLEGAAMNARAESVDEGQIQKAFEGLREVLRSVVLREGDMTVPRLREAIQQSGALAHLYRPAMAPADGRPRDLMDGIRRFLGAVREAGLPDGHLLSELADQAEQSLTSVEFLQTVNGLRRFLEEGSYLQIPFSIGGEQGTMDIVVRRDGEGESGKGGKENHSAVFLLELEGLGALRVDAGVQNSRVHIRFTTPDEEIGKFIEKEMPKLREAIETHELAVDGISWILGRAVPEPVIPTDEEEDLSGGNSYISLRV